MAFGLGGSSSSSKFNQSLANPEAWGDFYGNMNNAWSMMNPFMMGGFGMLPKVDPYMEGAAGAGAEGTNYMLEGGSFGNTQDIRNRLMGMMGGRSNMGSMYESIVGGAGNTYIDPMVAAMRKSGNEALDSKINSNAMTANAMGQGGSSRHAMENAMTNRLAMDDMNRLEADMRGGAYDKDLAMKMSIAQQADSNRQSEQDRLLSMLTGADKNVGYGMSYQPTMQNLGMGMMAPYMQAFMMPWMAASAYSGAMGDPTVLSKGKSSGASGGFSI